MLKWKKEFLEKGAEVFGGRDEVRVYEQKISKLERMLGQKEVYVFSGSGTFWLPSQETVGADADLASLGLMACRRASVTPFNLLLLVWMESRLPKYTSLGVTLPRAS